MTFYLGRKNNGGYELSQTKDDWDPEDGFFIRFFKYKDLGDFLEPGEVIEVGLKVIHKVTA